MSDRLSRRSYIRAVAGSASLVALAGCSGGDGGGTPSGEDTAEPTSTVTPTPEPTPTPESVPDPIEGQFEGSGDSTVSVDVELMGPTAFAMEHRGSSNFAVEVYDGDGEQVALLANEIGSWRGANLTDLALEEHTLDITADGEWWIGTTQQPQYLIDEVATGWPVEVEGSTDNYIGPIDFSEGRTLSLSATGDSNNVAMIRDSFGAVAEVAVNEIGPYEGSGVVSISDSVGWIDVEMSGEYQLVLEE